MKSNLTTMTLSLLLALPLGLAGCGSELSDDISVGDVESALEKENGGYEMNDEAATFGRDDLFREARDGDEERAILDVIEDTAEVREMRDRPEAVLFHTAIAWGQIPANWELETPRNWDGAFRVNRGAIIVRSVVLFEGATDELLERTDRKVVAFRSTTLPHRDGLRLTIIDPSPELDEPLTLTYENQEGVLMSVNVRDLVRERHTVVVDDLNNRMVALAIPQPVDACQYGFIGGKWLKLTPRLGFMLGRVTDVRGTAVGHMRGVYGVRRNGDKVFFGKYINLAGEFKGIYRGVYGDGHFHGRWINRSGDVGELGGQYRTTDRPFGIGGHFLGRWMETSCNLPVDMASDQSEGSEGE